MKGVKGREREHFVERPKPGAESQGICSPPRCRHVDGNSFRASTLTFLSCSTNHRCPRCIESSANGFPGEVRGKGHSSLVHALGRSYHELLGGNRQELPAQQAVLSMELRVRPPGKHLKKNSGPAHNLRHASNAHPKFGKTVERHAYISWLFKIRATFG